MLYEVITFIAYYVCYFFRSVLFNPEEVLSQQGSPLALPIFYHKRLPKTFGLRLIYFVFVAMNVITSYSIHYTKLYDASYKARFSGRVEFRNANILIDRDGKMIVTNRRFKLVIVSEDGRELEEHSSEYGAIVHVKDGDMVSKGQS